MRSNGPEGGGQDARHKLPGIKLSSKPVIKPVVVKEFGGAVVQSVRIPACHAGGRGFESRPHRQRREENE